MSPSENDYNRFSDGNDADFASGDVGSDDEIIDELENWALSSNHTCFSLLAWITGIIFVGSSITYVDELVQVHGGKIQGTEYWTPYLAILVSLAGLYMQARLVSIPFRWYIQGPIIRRYKQEGFHAIARVVKRKQTKSGSRKVTLVYRPAEHDFMTMYTKEVYVGEDEFEMEEFPVVILPNIPTSAILRQRFEDLSAPSTRDKNIWWFGIVVPIMWLSMAGYAVCMELLSETDPWVTWGLLWLFSICLVSSISWGYIMIVFEAKSWLDGDAMLMEEFEANEAAGAQPCHAVCLEMI